MNIQKLTVIMVMMLAIGFGFLALLSIDSFGPFIFSSMLATQWILILYLMKITDQLDKVIKKK